MGPFKRGRLYLSSFISLFLLGMSSFVAFFSPHVEDIFFDVYRLFRVVGIANG